MNTAYARKIVKDNQLNAKVVGRTNGVVSIYSDDDDSLRTLNELLKGMGYALEFHLFPRAHYKIVRA